jgi:hypothetical protein
VTRPLLPARGSGRVATVAACALQPTVPSLHAGVMTALQQTSEASRDGGHLIRHAAFAPVAAELKPPFGPASCRKGVRCGAWVV